MDHSFVSPEETLCILHPDAFWSAMPSDSLPQYAQNVKTIPVFTQGRSCQYVKTITMPT